MIDRQCLTPLLRNSLLRTPKISLRNDEGVLTATDSNMFVGFQLLYSSLVAQHRCQVAVVDLGLRPSELAWCRQQRSLLVITPVPEGLRLVGEFGWQRWNKPFYLLLTPFSHTLWLDADVIAIRELPKLFDMIIDGPVIPGTVGDIGRDDSFFRRMPGNVDVPELAACPSTAVLGFERSRDALILRLWADAVERIANDKSILSVARLYDAGALAWALARAGMSEDLLENRVWNWHAEYGGIRGVQYDSPAELLHCIRADFRVAHIVRWQGVIKPWLHWLESELDISPHAA